MHTFITPEAKKELIEALKEYFDTPYEGDEDRAFRNAIICAISMVESFPTESAWIRVGDRLPNDCVKVLVFDEKCKDVFHALFDEKGFFMPLPDFNDFTKVTHWQPLPPPPSLPPVT